MIEPSTYYAYDAPPKSHGRVSTYTNYKCRCPECREAKRTSNKRRYTSTVAREQRLEKNREILREAKSAACADCGSTYPPYVMDFDHKDPVQKRANVGTLISGTTARLLEEIAKCDVVCANCHRVRTHVTRQVDTHAFFNPR